MWSQLPYYNHCLRVAPGHVVLVSSEALAKTKSVLSPSATQVPRSMPSVSTCRQAPPYAAAFGMLGLSMVWKVSGFQTPLVMKGGLHANK